VLRGEHGECLLVERRYALGHVHGGETLEAALRHAPALRPHERGPGGEERLDLSRAVFLDTETTGLSGGTGTVAFLVGAGRVEGSEFVVRQYGLRDYPDEPALLHALLEDLADRPLVTFNGRSFDWPLLTTRLHLHRLRPGGRAHLDLLPSARRIWARTLPSRSLGTLERHILAFERPDDLPGWMVPDAWFDYLKTGRTTAVARAFTHNEHDVVSMLALVGAMGTVLSNPEGRSPPRDALGTARLLLDLGDVSGAQRSLESGIAGAAGEEARALRRALATLERRLGAHGRALEHWTTIVRSGGGFDAEAYEQVAKIHEHRLRDPAGALRWVEEALERAPAGSRCHHDLLHRAARLRRALARGDTPR
jgi:uncharacterized protein YprB with RNaseH-like and TPR domain